MATTGFYFHIRIFWWYLQCFTHSRLEVRMPPCKCVLSKDCLLFGNVPVLVKDTTFSCICSGLRTPDWNLECLQEDVF